MAAFQAAVVAEVAVAVGSGNLLLNASGKHAEYVKISAVNKG